MNGKVFDPALLAEFRRLLDGAHRAVLVGHLSPDGDALGSTLGLCHMLRKRGVDARVLTPDEPSHVLRSLPGARDVMAFSSFGDMAIRFVEKCDLVICLDFNALSRISRLAPVIKASTAPKILIDHHLYPEDFADVTFSYPEMSSTCELVYDILTAAGLGDEIDLTAATCFTTGIMTDTGGLHYNSDSPRLFETLAGLMRRGVDKTRIIRFVLDTQSADSMALESFALSQRFKLYPEYHAAVITLSRDDLNAYNYRRGDTEGLVNRPLQIPGVAYSVYFREEKDYIKVSARSLGDFPVNEICHDLYGGGGHLNAAGGEFSGTIDEAVKLLEQHMPEVVPKISPSTMDIVNRKSLLPKN